MEPVKYKSLCAGAAVSLFLFTASLVPASAQGKNNEEAIHRVMGAISRVQVYLEFYFMETSVYPRSLKALETILNDEAAKDGERIVFPRDPATGKEFIYEPSKDQKGYRLAVPDPARYGMKKLELAQVNWGWLSLIAEEKRRKAFAFFCKSNIDVLTAMSKKYQEQEKKLPQSLKDLLTKYPKGLPVCPLSGKEYIYGIKDGVFTISCPNPREHGFVKMMFSSKDGFIAEPLDTQQGREKLVVPDEKPIVPQDGKQPPTQGEKQAAPQGEKQAAPRGDRQFSPPKKEK